MNEFMDALADRLEQEGHFELYRGEYGDLRTSAQVWLREDERDVIVEALRLAAPSADVRMMEAYRSGALAANQLVGCLWSDLFNKDLVKSEGADYFDKWRDRIKALTPAREETQSEGGSYDVRLHENILDQIQSSDGDAESKQVIPALETHIDHLRPGGPSKRQATLRSREELQTSKQNPEAGVAPGPSDPTPEVREAWPPLKMAIWKVITGENLNDGHYINAYDLTDKLLAALTAAPAPVDVEAIKRAVWSAIDPSFEGVARECAEIAIRAIDSLFNGPGLETRGK